MKISFVRLGASVLFLIYGSLLFSQDTAKIMSYNLLNYSGQASKNANFRKSVNFAKPDVLVVEEILSESAMNTMLSEVMNIYSPGVYSAGTFIDGYDTDNAVFFKNSKFSFVSNTPIHTSLRDINMFTLVHIASRDTIRLFAVHLKASSTPADEQQRLAEVNALRAVTNTFPAGTEFMIMGDFNIYNSTEPAYVRLLQVETGNEGYFVDPYFLPGTWNQFSYASQHSQSTRTRSIGDGGATGGLDDRFDFILNSNGVTQEGMVKYIPGTLKPFGNDGNHYNDSINKRPNTAVPDSIADALYYGSDHLPVQALYKFDTHPNSISDINSNAVSFILYQNFPNPFNPTTIINYKLRSAGFVTLKIFDSVGREIGSFINRKLHPGTYSFKWNARSYSSGVYYYKLTAGNFSETKSMMLLK